MNIYSIALSLHMTGALGFFAALGLEWFSLQQIRRSSSNEQFLKKICLFNGIRNAGMISMLLLISSGLYMALTAWGQPWWAFVTLGTLVLLFIPAAVLTGMRVEAVRQGLTMEDRPDSPSSYPLLRHPLLRISIRTRLALALAVLYLMNTKPSLGGALLAVGIATLTGLAISLPLPHREQMPGQPVE